MDLSSAIRIIEQTHDRLVIYQPPYWPFALGFLAGGVVLAVGLFVFFTLLSVKLPVRFAGFVLAIPFLVVGASAAASEVQVQASLPDRTVSIRRRGLFGSDTRTIRLDDVDAAVDLQARRSTAVGLRLRSGETINLTGFTDQSGKSAMLGSLQLFLASARSHR
jgi:hypothetical protein